MELRIYTAKVDRVCDYCRLAIKQGEKFKGCRIAVDKPLMRYHAGCVKPSGIKVTTPKKPPTTRTLERWMTDGVAKSTDGCTVEPDGYCSHGNPSWFIRLGMI